MLCDFFIAENDEGGDFFYEEGSHASSTGASNELSSLVSGVNDEIEQRNEENNDYGRRARSAKDYFHLL